MHVTNDDSSDSRRDEASNHPEPTNDGPQTTDEAAPPSLEQEGNEESDDDEATPAVKPPLDPEMAKALSFGIETFDDLPLHERVREGIAKIGWTLPTPVQKLCLPYTLHGRDVAGFAQTGTGKTGVFLITIINRLLQAATVEGIDVKAPRAVVLAPTRELAMQIEDDAQGLFQFTGIKSLAVFGGVDYDKQASALRDGVDVIVATPGRLKDYVQKKWVDMKNIQVFVCDEADRMFDMGFIEDVEFFLEKIPETSQKLLFSATTNEEVKELAFEYLEAPEYISVNPEVITPEKIEQHAIHCHATQKLKVMLGMLRDHNPARSIIFTNTKLTAEWLHFKLEGNGIECDLITGDLPQKKRIRLIQRIKEGKLKALIATDVASRGLHIAGVTHVYNFDLPDDAANYVHRIGRTARAGEKGASYALVCDDYGQNLAAINELLGEASVTSGWYDERYMEIEDKAGNPFEDRYARRSNNYEDSRYEGRGGSRGSHGDRGDYNGGRNRRGGPDGDRQRRPHEGQNRPQQHSRGSQAPHQSQHPRSTSSGSDRHTRGSQPSRSIHTTMGTQPLATKQSTQRGFVGMVKHLWALLFGRKKPAAETKQPQTSENQRHDNNKPHYNGRHNQHQRKHQNDNSRRPNKPNQGQGRREHGQQGQGRGRSPVNTADATSQQQGQGNGKGRRRGRRRGKGRGEGQQAGGPSGQTPQN